MGKSNYEILADKLQPVVLQKKCSKEDLLAGVRDVQDIYNHEILKEISRFIRFNVPNREGSTLEEICTKLKDWHFFDDISKEVAIEIVAHSYGRISEEIEGILEGREYWIVPGTNEIGQMQASTEGEDLISKSALLKEMRAFAGKQRYLIPEEIWAMVENFSPTQSPSGVGNINSNTKDYSLILSEDGEGAMLIDLKARNDMSRKDVFDAIRLASVEYCNTEEGRAFFDENYKVFDYLDFSTYVPNEICRKYGIEKVENPNKVVVNDRCLGEPLVGEIDLENDEVER